MSFSGSVFSNFFTGGWSGPASTHYMIERDALLEMRASESDPNEMRWLTTAIEATEKNIE
jgi:hypothetical protein